MWDGAAHSTCFYEEHCSPGGNLPRKKTHQSSGDRGSKLTTNTLWRSFPRYCFCFSLILQSSFTLSSSGGLCRVSSISIGLFTLSEGWVAVDIRKQAPFLFTLPTFLPQIHHPPPTALQLQWGLAQDFGGRKPRIEWGSDSGHWLTIGEKSRGRKHQG